jgi:hypothetical protein
MIDITETFKKIREEFHDYMADITEGRLQMSMSRKPNRYDFILKKLADIEDKIEEIDRKLNREGIR